MKRLFEKWFCKHKWNVHAQKEVRYSWFDAETKEKLPNTKDIIREVLICENCGKIKTIEY